MQPILDLHSTIDLLKEKAKLSTFKKLKHLHSTLALLKITEYKWKPGVIW